MVIGTVRSHAWGLLVATRAVLAWHKRPEMPWPARESVIFVDRTVLLAGGKHSGGRCQSVISRTGHLMDKLAYIVRTLSRTRRKDYENYVVNAVWQRLADPGVKPVTQQYVRRADGSYYLIDLYFPQLSMGVECDEGYHESRGQRDRDARREMELIDTPASPAAPSRRWTPR